ncbi:uncharacterized protein OCT59_009729 [Rhizophagus irregularis]|uniref:Uncharacterized protein n=1 Tax=Rhizophagus irregularis (strain DAOM 181602 / DAOM 197198 / MUCL 43194) TaxID=747089 RepID=U9UTS0_RHIID|nr:hypothetical protein GLOIN_2v1786967 [Rhizophagus irregularis DAOM 181602=DAOM 197198]POG61148.1 hypothetical protein GLOIN_2v1786967 [Rhizophagus irregularis DAOM 181602=DAOM 197198]UZO18416.1 hypothetical protein OCT59_009729 [Rhizophagus irregularis]GBC29075.1 hypothetical protein GLOIN_2v1786967 [Rhizophagus irregularis DAOM 181602=DAOM 197198]CAG8722400.1 6239_t:CDS:2 [Rhizophagus irregularis]|eukprot:XP_025168014.1 hypothetical protein GLOIN_2v1786967 [Rhizophagus irregularis DAOM 181602=DAOM 197198]
MDDIRILVAMDFGATYSGIVVVNSFMVIMPGRGVPKDTALQYDEGHKKVTSWEFSFIDEKNDEVSDDTEGQHSHSVEYNEKERISLNYIIHKLLKIII